MLLSQGDTCYNDVFVLKRATKVFHCTKDALYELDIVN